MKNIYPLNKIRLCQKLTELLSPDDEKERRRLYASYISRPERQLEEFYQRRLIHEINSAARKI